MEKQAHISTVASVGSYLDTKDHEVDLAAITSNPISIGEVGASLTSDQKFYILRRLNLEGLTSFENLPVTATFMIEKVQNMTIPDALTVLKDTLIEHDNDINYPTKDLEFLQVLVDNAEGQSQEVFDIKETLGSKFAGEKSEKFVGSEEEVESINQDVDFHTLFDWHFQVKLEAALIAYYSPYPEIRSITDPYDDPTIPCETFRAYLIGFIWNAIGTFINQFFVQRQPPISFTSTVGQLFIYPSGILCQYIFPNWSFKVLGRQIDLNPGPWNFKEQMFASIIFSVAGGGTSYVQYNIFAQKSPVFYGNTWVTWGYQILLILSTNFLGFGFAGVLRRFVIYPIRAIWPSILPTIALNKALTKPEKKEVIHGWKISRYYFFFATVSGSFLWNWIPSYLFQALSTFNWMTWIAPDNMNLAAVTGSISGLGLNPITTFDWNIIDYNSCLWLPFYTYVNQYIGAFLALFCILGVWYSNYKWTGYLPINSNATFDNKGKSYAIRKILDEKGLFNKEAYEEYGPPFYSAANLVLYGAFFAIYPFSIIYETMNNYKSYYHSFKAIYVSIRHWNRKSSVYDGQNDPHSRMMSNYNEVPDWWFLIILVISIVLAIVMVEVYPTETPVWALFFAIGINFLFLIPLTMIYSTTGFSFGLNVLVELIIGYAIPGNSMALMIIKAFGYNIDGQAQNYISDQKMAHYAKVPPRAIFRGQLISVLMSSFISLALVNWQLDTVEGICTPNQSNKFTCPGARTFFTASVFWGTIGPKKVFGGLYPVLQWCFLIGALLAPVCWAFKYYFKKQLKYFQPTIIIGGFLLYAPYNLSYLTPGLYVSTAFMFVIRRKFTSWWEKYNYVLAGGLQAGVAFSAIIIFFAVQYHDKSISWWGNNVPFMGVDSEAPRLLNITTAPDGYFGPRVGSFP